MNRLISIAERGHLPDLLVRAGIRGLLRQRLRRSAAAVEPLATGMGDAHLAVATEEANAQHYELPAPFFELMLGPRLKYSGCEWADGDDLPRAEERALETVSRRAGLADGMEILDLGCGWGSFSLWAAARFPASRITTVSNSEGQRRFIRSRAQELGLTNLDCHRADVNHFRPERCVDRVVSIEMFEHVRNHAALLDRIASWLRPGGKLFVHIFCHKSNSYPFELDGDNDWMARHFFTGGVMPSFDLLAELDAALGVEQRWKVDGTHYRRTLHAWLARLDRRRDEALEILTAHYGAADAGLWLNRWRLFLLACAELFGYRDGREWFVGHYLLTPRQA